MRELLILSIHVIASSAASSFGKWPRMRTERCSFAFRLSMELVVYIIRRSG
jgi:hypothetical protein